MKKWILFTLVAFVSCDKRQDSRPEVTSFSEEKSTPVTYEGRVPLDENTNLYITLSMVPDGESGAGAYEVREYVETENSTSDVTSFKGSYSTLIDPAADERIIQYHNSIRPKGLKRSYLAPGLAGNSTGSSRTMIREEPFRTTDLTVRTAGKLKLAVLDNNLKVVTAEPEYNLVRRTSKLFTIEGYFRHNGYSASFYEMNTSEDWDVTKYGDYHKAIRQYHQLTSKKFEVTYLKGVAFSTLADDGGEALVIRKVLQMTTAPAINRE